LLHAERLIPAAIAPRRVQFPREFPIQKRFMNGILL
jgi:hypothetical protein